jgi:thiamine-monophosphate kinase
MSGEFGLIRWIREQTPTADRVLIGPGDDCASLSPGRNPLLVTTDMLMDGTDFVLAEVGARRVGRKAMAVNLSDLAAMAGLPVAVVVSVALPKSTAGVAEDLYRGLREMADRFQVPIVGGDTNSWDGPLVVSVTALGEATARGAVRRNGAKPGDWIFVTGPLGGSILGHHLDFEPRITQALTLHESVEIHAMIDISDGLSADFHHILEESQCGAVLEGNAIPITAAAHTFSQSSGRSALEHALGDGEDFELVFTVSERDGRKLIADSPIPLWKIGECVEAGYWLNLNGKRQELKPTGWVHSFA